MQSDKFPRRNILLFLHITANLLDVESADPLGESIGDSDQASSSPLRQLFPNDFNILPLVQQILVSLRGRDEEDVLVDVDFLAAVANVYFLILMSFDKQLHLVQQRRIDFVQEGNKGGEDYAAVVVVLVFGERILTDAGPLLRLAH